MDGYFILTNQYLYGVFLYTFFIKKDNLFNSTQAEKDSCLALSCFGEYSFTWGLMWLEWKDMSWPGGIDERIWWHVGFSNLEGHLLLVDMRLRDSAEPQQ